jgi:hypothetical protein
MKELQDIVTSNGILVNLKLLVFVSAVSEETTTELEASSVFSSEQFAIVKTV